MDKVQTLLVKNIKRMRKKLGYSQMRLSELSSLSSSFIAEIETGRKFPSSSTLQKIADALGLKPHQLFIDEEESFEWERIDVVTQLCEDLKARLDKEIDSVRKEHSG